MPAVRMLLLLLLLLLISLKPAPASAQVEASPDIAVDLSGVLVFDRQLADDDLNGGIALTSLGLPAGVDADAFHEETSGDLLFSTDTAVALPGGVTAAPEDVVSFDGVAYTLVFDGSAHGVPAGVNVDAVSRAASADLVLSFDATVTLGGASYGDESLVGWDGAVFFLVADLASFGFDPALDLDAAHYDTTNNVLFVSFDGHGSHAGTHFADEDVVRVDFGGGSSAFYDASAEHAGWAPADLDALPEPGGAGGALAAAALLAWLARRRARTASDAKVRANGFDTVTLFSGPPTLIELGPNRCGGNTTCP